MKRVDFLVLIMIGLLLSIKVTTLSSAGTSLTIKATETSKLDVSFASQAISIFFAGFL